VSYANNQRPFGAGRRIRHNIAPAKGYELIVRRAHPGAVRTLPRYYICFPSRYKRPIARNSEEFKDAIAVAVLTAVLAQSELGARCSKCWMTLRCVHGNHPVSGEEASRQLSAIHLKSKLDRFTRMYSQNV
jgi:hypothetical protein